ncbi:hypothetical protein TNCV_3917671 [Trichonephila clavipes]|nr:hypothetical protein TNCV_3917671 [Trichonephila clavipes]
MMVICVRGFYDHLDRRRGGGVLVKGQEQHRVLSCPWNTYPSKKNAVVGIKPYRPIITKTFTEREIYRNVMPSKHTNSPDT